MTKQSKTVKLSKQAQMAAFVVRQAAFVRQLEAKQYTAVPHLQISHDRDLAEARQLLARARDMAAARVLVDERPTDGVNGRGRCANDEASLLCAHSQSRSFPVRRGLAARL